MTENQNAARIHLTRTAAKKATDAKNLLAKRLGELQSWPVNIVVNSLDPARPRRSADQSSLQQLRLAQHPLFPGSGLATGSCKGLYARRKLLAITKANLWNQEMRDQLTYFDGELDAIDNIPEAIKLKHKTVFGIDYGYLLDAATPRQKWIDQSQSVNLFLATTDIQGASARSNLNRRYRRA